MVLQSLGIREGNWNTKTRVTYNAVTIQKDRALLFFLQQPPPQTTTTNQYLAVVASLGTSYGEFEVPLECKYFPGSAGIMFAVAVPDADYDKDVNVTVSVLPKEFKPGSASVKQLDFELFYDDELQKEIVYPVS